VEKKDTPIFIPFFLSPSYFFYLKIQIKEMGVKKLGIKRSGRKE